MLRTTSVSGTLYVHMHSPDDERDGVALQPVGLEYVVVARQKTVVVGHYPLVAAPAPSRPEAIRHRQDIPVLYQRVLSQVSVRQSHVQGRGGTWFVTATGWIESVPKGGGGGYVFVLTKTPYFRGFHGNVFWLSCVA